MRNPIQISFILKISSSIFKDEIEIPIEVGRFAPELQLNSLCIPDKLPVCMEDSLPVVEESTESIAVNEIQVEPTGSKRSSLLQMYEKMLNSQ